MRALILILCAASFACDDTTATAPALDLSVTADLAVAPDLSTGMLDCAGIVLCINQCAAASLNTCVPACIARGTSTGQTFFGPLQSCSSPACYRADGGAAPCSTPASTACTTCVSDNCSAQLARCNAN